MSRALHMNLPDELEAEIEAAVSLGEYPSAEAAVVEAIEQWRTARGLDADELRHAWERGLASGDGRGLSIDDIKSEARSRLTGG